MFRTICINICLPWSIVSDKMKKIMNIAKAFLCSDSTLKYLVRGFELIYHMYLC